MNLNLEFNSLYNIFSFQIRVYIWSFMSAILNLGSSMRHWSFTMRNLNFHFQIRVHIWSFVSAILHVGSSMRHCSFTMRNLNSHFQIRVHIWSFTSAMLHLGSKMLHCSFSILSSQFWSFCVRDYSFTIPSSHLIFCLRCDIVVSVELSCSLGAGHFVS